MTTTTTHTNLYINENGGAYELTTEPMGGGEVIALVHDRDHAAVLCSAYEFFDALLEVSDIASNMVEADERERIMTALSVAFGKLYQEAS